MIPAIPITDPILQFTALVTAVLLVQLTLERVHLPGITGLLVFGMLVGPDGLGYMPREPVTAFLGSIGLVYIMFLAGLEIDLDVARQHTGEVVFLGLGLFGLSLAPAVGIGLVMGLAWPGALLIGAALSSHTLLAYPIVERFGLVHRRPIVSAVGGTLITDTLALMLLVVTMQAAVAGGGTLGAAAPLLALAALVAFSLYALPPFSRWFFERGGADRPERALFILVVVLLLSSAAELIGTEDILGAFLAGICLNRAVRAREELHEHVAFVGRMLFIPFFFVDTGMRLELEVFAGHSGVWLLAGLLLLVVLFGKSAAAWLAGRRYGYSALDRGTVVGLTIPQAAATLAVTVTAAEAGVLGTEIVDAVIIVIFITCLAGPLVTRWCGRRLAEAGGSEPEEEEEDGTARRSAP
jgi:Kef-type K+ transport system membrane component KefB